jgi:hypothetical protein
MTAGVRHDVPPLARAGAITEIVGPLSSGRTSLLVRALAEATRAGVVAALVDADGAFDPAGAARGGVELSRLLWVRGDGRRAPAVRAADLLVRCPGFGLVVLDVGEIAPRLSLAGAFRLRLAVRQHDVALVVLSARRLTGAGAALAVETRQGAIAWTGPAATATRLAGLRSVVRVVRAAGGGLDDARPPRPAERWWCA